MRLSMNGIRVNNTAASASAIASMGGYGCKKYNVPGGDAEEFKAAEPHHRGLLDAEQGMARLQRQRPFCPCAGKLRRFRRIILFPDSKRRCVRSGHTAFLFTPDSVYFSSATGSGRSMPPQWLQSRQSRTDSQRLFQVPPSASASGSLHSSHRSRSHPRPGT